MNLNRIKKSSTFKIREIQMKKREPELKLYGIQANEKITCTGIFVSDYQIYMIHDAILAIPDELSKGILV